MSTNEKAGGRGPTATLVSGGVEPANEEDGIAILHRDIEAILPKLRRYARYLTRDAGDPDDLVQECLARSLAKLHLWEPGTDLRAWLFTLLHNLHASQHRRAARERKMVDWIKMMSAWSGAPDQIDHLEVRELERAIMSLPEQQRTAVRLICLTPGSYHAVASACGVPIGTIRSRLSRGRQNLRQLGARG